MSAVEREMSKRGSGGAGDVLFFDLGRGHMGAFAS